MTSPALRQTTIESLFQRIPQGRTPSSDAVERLTLYLELLEKWSVKMNLVATRDRKRGRILERHLLDSLQGWEEIERRHGPFSPSMRWVDVGSGGGFPGMAIALAWKIPFDLYEANGKKASFLSVVRAKTAADWITIHNRRWEENPIEAIYDGATTRATFSSWSTFEAGWERLKAGAPAFLWRSEPYLSSKTPEFPAPEEQFSYQGDDAVDRWIWRFLSESK